ncbi:MAG: hypothetical protein K9G70_07750 [Prolixibacteraceae bacterium]|nr:hypothetical protein [Prolixibacteraceae bacterium]
MIIIEKIYCKEDHKKNLFKNNTLLWFVVGDINYDITTNIVDLVNTQNPKLFTYRIAPKYERYARKGWSSGWINIENPIIHNWHPAIIERNFTCWADVDGINNNVTAVLTATAKITAEALDMAGIAEAFPADEKKYGDYLYGNQTYTRSSFKYLYNTLGTTWGEEGETNYPLLDHGRRPALQIGPDLLFLTTWETYPID